MKKNKTKYSWLLTPILACLMLTQASCSNDIAENTSDPVPGGTYLTIVTRGINTTTPTEYEDYVKTLRVIAFKNGVLALNELLGVDDIPDTSGTVDEVELTNVEKLKLGTGGGAYTFYFIANEEGHTTTENNANLSQTLSGITNETDLKNINVNFANQTTPMLMSTHQTEYIEEGVDKTIIIELVRSVAKINLNVVNETERQQTLSDIAFSNMNVQTTSLIEGDNLPITGTSFTPYTNGITVQANGKIEDQIAYIFESSVTGSNNYVMSLNWNNKPYSESLSGVLGTAFKRNTELEINITLKQTYTPEFTILVLAWTPIDIEVPEFD